MGNIKVFQVTKTTPSPLAEGVDTLLEIHISFNTDVNVKSLTGGITIIGRNNNKPITGSVSYEIDKPISGYISYDKNRTVTFKPANALDPSTTYDVFVKSSIRNILGMNCKAFSFSFTTKNNAQFNKPMLTFPSNETILSSTPEFKWEKTFDTKNIEATRYEIEVSKSEYFETNYWLSETTLTKLQSNFEIETGELLFWRVRVLTYDENSNILPGPWSDVFRFIIAKSKKAPIVDADGDYLDPAYIDLPPTENYFIRQFPDYNFSNVGLNLKTIFIEINGILDINKIDPRKWTIEGNHITGNINIEDYDPNGDEDEWNHKFLTGKWFVAIDEDLQTTYIIFEIDKL